MLVMKNILHIAFLIFVFGVMLTPLHLLACEKMSSHSENACCKKNKVGTALIKDCCAKGNKTSKHYNAHSKNNTHRNCDDCDQSCCSCAPTVLSFTLPAIVYLEDKTFNLPKVSPSTSFIETFISSGFLSIWLPPKLV